jgi:N6-adenosine-specific RNA methylase IME4
MDRAAGNHYATMPSEQIRALQVPAADDAVLSLECCLNCTRPLMSILRSNECLIFTQLVAHAVTPTANVTTPRIKVRCEFCADGFKALRCSAKTCSPACRQGLSRLMRAATPPLPAGPFDLILADPPYPFTTYSQKGQGKSPSAHFKTRSVDWIRRLPIRAVAAPSAGLALWVYGPLLPEALEIMRRWSFNYNSDLLTWIKTTKNGKPTFGTGYTTRKNTETMIYGTRGNGLKVVDHGVRQSLFAERQEHSRKPDEAAKALERLFGPVRRLELFARRRRAGWEAWGDELAPNEV